ncbi:ATP-binding protein [Mesosutterella sp. AGMB02718]|uniref:histidine kinase n=1 Tax=Mesosutterella faecium TaxID=2925194 RepID=A0ABT7IKQ6_9BURK|nr:ATP-binding protein [Mesosutterella sp. AGMB02718]MDL2058944.1 ATP-binding protein [Mesosutterella sp. AGMB02718]
MKKLRLLGGTLLALCSPAALAEGPEGSFPFLVFLLLNARHLLYGACLAVLFVLVRGQAHRPAERSGAVSAAALLFFGLLQALLCPFAASLSWLNGESLVLLLLVLAGGTLLLRRRPDAAPVFPAAAASAFASGLAVFALKGSLQPLLVAEAASFCCLLLWGWARWGRSPAAQDEGVVRREAEQEAVARERARYIRDMHDGLGAELVSTLAAAKTGKLSQEALVDSLQSCLDQMRLAIDSSGVGTEDLTAALANLRYRMEPRLRAAGIHLVWDVSGMPDDFACPPELSFCALGVLQEALTNAVKYSGADRLEVKASVDGGVLLLSAADNGRGMAPGAVSDRSQGNGLGLANMNRRVREAGGELSVSAGPQARGVQVRLKLPVA